MDWGPRSDIKWAASRIAATERAVWTTARGAVVVPDVKTMNTGSSACRATGGVAGDGRDRMRRAASIDGGVPGSQHPTRTNRQLGRWLTAGNSRRLLRHSLRGRLLDDSA